MRSLGRQLGKRNFAAYLLMLTLAACSQDATTGTRQATVSEILANESHFDGQKVLLREVCLLGSLHGLTFSNCNGGRMVGALVFSSKIAQPDQADLYAAVLREALEKKRPLSVSLCGTYRRHENGRDRWFIVEKVFVESKATGALGAC
jgi:hypothetical protein